MTGARAADARAAGGLTAEARSAGPVLALLDAEVAEVADGVRLTLTAAELLTVARDVATGLGVPLEVVWTGVLDDAVVASLGAHGATRVHHLADEPVTTSELAGALTGLVAAASPAALLATTSFASRELAARLGVRLGVGVLVDATRLEVVDGRLVADRTAFAASWGSRCAVLTSPAVVTVKPHATASGSAVTSSAGPRGSGAPAVGQDPAVGPVPDVVPLAPGTPDPRVRVVERTPRLATGRPDLATAAVVVAGGRGTEGDFTVLEELAAVLGAAVGSTRVATDEGWVGHEIQVGQTGVTINPVLYVGAGVSGAIHHVGGMRAAQTVVAINTDPDAPLMEIADYAVVGDLFDVVPQLTARLRELRGDGR